MDSIKYPITSKVNMKVGNRKALYEATVVAVTIKTYIDLNGYVETGTDYTLKIMDGSNVFRVDTYQEAALDKFNEVA